MKLSAIGSNGQEIKTEVDEISEEAFNTWNVFELSRDQLARRLDGLGVSADTKALLNSLSTTVMRVGEVVIKIGRRILDSVFNILSAYPNTTFGAVFGAIAGFLISCIPFIGVLLGPLVFPI